MQTGVKLLNKLSGYSFSPQQTEMMPSLGEIDFSAL